MNTCAEENSTPMYKQYLYIHVYATSYTLTPIDSCTCRHICWTQIWTPFRTQIFYIDSEGMTYHFPRYLVAPSLGCRSSPAWAPRDRHLRVSSASLGHRFGSCSTAVELMDCGDSLPCGGATASATPRPAAAPRLVVSLRPAAMQVRRAVAAATPWVRSVGHHARVGCEPLT